MNQVAAIAVAVLLGVPAVVGVIWLRTRPMRNGTLSQAWGQPDDEDARAEIERIFPGSTDSGEPLPPR